MSRYYIQYVDMVVRDAWAVRDNQNGGTVIAVVYDEPAAQVTCDFLNARAAVESGEAVEVHPLLSSMVLQKKLDEMTDDELADADFETAYDIMVENARDLRRALSGRGIVPLPKENGDEAK